MSFHAIEREPRNIGADENHRKIREDAPQVFDPCHRLRVKHAVDPYKKRSRVCEWLNIDPESKPWSGHAKRSSKSFSDG